jgi:hypothetical protein
MYISRNKQKQTNTCLLWDLRYTINQNNINKYISETSRNKQTHILQPQDLRLNPRTINKYISRNKQKQNKHIFFTTTGLEVFLKPIRTINKYINRNKQKQTNTYFTTTGLQLPSIQNNK